MANIYEMTDTWNDAGTVFTAIEMDVTNTASAAGSWLLNLKVGGVNKFSVSPDGAGYFIGDNVVIGVDAGANRRSIYRVGNGLMIEGRYVQLLMDQSLTIAPRAGFSVEQRNGTSPQTYNIYNTYTDASNYERGFMRWNSNVLEIGTEAAGTGSNRTVKIMYDGGDYLTVSNNTVSMILASVTRYNFQHNAATFNEPLTINESLTVTGNATLTGLPTSDPAVAGRLWNDAGTVKISAG